MAIYPSLLVHTPQQNGIVKSKNKHLVDSTRTLLFGVISFHHWGDAILTTWFLINRMLCSSLNNKVPYSILFPNDPLFMFPLTCSVVYVLFMIYLQGWINSLPMLNVSS